MRCKVVANGAHVDVELVVATAAIFFGVGKAEETCFIGEFAGFD